MKKAKTGVGFILNERLRQQEVEGVTDEQDDTYTAGQLAMAAATYAMTENARNHYKPVISSPLFFPWPDRYWKPTPDDRVKELAKAGALIAAEIDRLLRLNKLNNEKQAHKDESAKPIR